VQFNSDALVIPVLAEVRSVSLTSNILVAVSLFYGKYDQKRLQKAEGTPT